MGRQALDDHAYRAILSMVLARDLLPGEHIVESAIAESLGVSRGTVRAGLRTLMAQGLVVRRPHQGCFIRKYTPAQVCDLFETREAVEGMAARVMAGRGDDASIEGLCQLATAVERDGYESDLAAFSADNYEFHRRLVQECGNPFLGELSNVDALLLTTHLYGSGNGLGPPWSIPVTHAEIGRAIASRDPDAAEAAARSHLRAAREWMARAARASDASRDASGRPASDAPVGPSSRQ